MLYREYDPQVLKRVQETELEILSDFIDLCERHQIDYFGVGGTAIGAIRHQGFIPWDDDIDIGFLRKDYDRFLLLAKEELSDKYELLNVEETQTIRCPPRVW
ncbi:MAG: phosphorylcholine transferase LicD [Christensenellales bacterium]